MRKVAIAALVLSASGSVFASPCRVATLVPKVARRTLRLPISADGGFVVMAEQVLDATSRGSLADAAVHDDWRVRTDNKRLDTPVLDRIAPGLVVYRIPAGATTARLEDGAHATLDDAQIATKTDQRSVLEVPKVRAILRRDTETARHPNESVTVELAGKPPATAVAIVVTDERGLPLTWGAATEPSISVYSTGSGCAAITPGTKGPYTGDKVRVFWLDEVGHVSPASKSITVEKAML